MLRRCGNFADDVTDKFVMTSLITECQSSKVLKKNGYNDPLFNERITQTATQMLQQ